MPIAAMRWLPIQNGRVVELLVDKASCMACGAASSLRAIPRRARLASRDVHHPRTRDGIIHAVSRDLRHPRSVIPVSARDMCHSHGQYLEDSSGTGIRVLDVVDLVDLVDLVAGVGSAMMQI